MCTALLGCVAMVPGSETAGDVTLEARLAPAAPPGFRLLAGCDCGSNCFSEWRLCDLTRLVFTVTDTGTNQATTLTDTAGGYTTATTFKIKALKHNRTDTVSVAGYVGTSNPTLVTSDASAQLVTTGTTVNGKTSFEQTLSQSLPLAFLPRTFSGTWPIQVAVASAATSVEVKLEREGATGVWSQAAAATLNGAGGTLKFTGLKASHSYRAVASLVDASSQVVASQTVTRTADPTQSDKDGVFPNGSLSL
jgi:hypothetical protein